MLWTVDSLTVVLAALGVVLGVEVVAMLMRRLGRPEPDPAVCKLLEKAVNERELPVIAYDEDDDLEPTQHNGEARAAVPELGGVIYEADAATDEPTAQISAFTLRASAKTDQGVRRKRNEDALLVLRREGVYVVADGMGGHAGGAIASKLAVEAIADTFQASRFSRESPLHTIPRRAAELVTAIANANEAVRRVAQSKGALAEMGTTVVATRFCPRKRRLYIGHVGDSRCYRFRAGKLELLTQDHTMASFGVKGPDGNMLSRAIGVRDRVETDVMIVAPEPGDLYLLCSDGLTKMVPEDLIADVLMRVEEDRAVDELVRLANTRGGLDNITAVLVRVA